MNLYTFIYNYFKGFRKMTIFWINKKQFNYEQKKTKIFKNLINLLKEFNLNLDKNWNWNETN